MVRTLTAVVVLLAASPSFAVAQFSWHVFGAFCSNCTTAGVHNVLYDDGLHNDGAAGDQVFGADIVVDQPGGRYSWHATTDEMFPLTGYPWCPCQSSYTTASLWTSGPGDVVHFTFDRRSGDGWYPVPSVASDHGLPGPVPLEVGIDYPYDTQHSDPPQLIAPATKIGPIWEATALISVARQHNYAFQTPDRSVHFTGAYNGGCSCFLGEQPMARFTTTNPNTYIRFQFDETTGRMRADEVVPTPVRRTSWGLIRAMYR